MSFALSHFLHPYMQVAHTPSQAQAIRPMGKSNSRQYHTLVYSVASSSATPSALRIMLLPLSVLHCCPYDYYHRLYGNFVCAVRAPRKRRNCECAYQMTHSRKAHIALAFSSYFQYFSEWLNGFIHSLSSRSCSCTHELTRFVDGAPHVRRMALVAHHGREGWIIDLEKLVASPTRSKTSGSAANNEFIRGGERNARRAGSARPLNC